MNTLVFAFRRNAPGLVSRLIRFVTKSDDKVSHVEVKFPNGLSFSSREWHGAAWKEIDYNVEQVFGEIDANGDWIFVELIDVSDEAIEAAAAWADAQCGRKYDYLGILLFYLNKRNKNKRLFCSKAACKIGQACGRFAGVDASMVSPQRMLDLIRADYQARTEPTQ
jgi:hypothetical protein